MARVEPDLVNLLERASEALIAQLAAALAELDLTTRHYCVLDKASGGALTQGQLAEETLLDKTTMVVTLDALESAGLARRVACTRDRRMRVVETTDAGERLLERAATVVRGVYDDVLGTVDVSRRDDLVAVLTELVGPGGPLHGDSRGRKTAARSM